MNKFFLSVLITFLFCEYSIGQNILHKEMLGKPTNSSITIKAIFDTVVEVKTYYGNSSGNYTMQTAWELFNIDSTGESVAVINLSNLIPDTIYFYMLKYRKIGSSTNISRPEYRFRTARSVGKSFIFTVQADPHLDSGSDTALYRLCLKNQLEANPDFMFDLGDIFMSEKLFNSSHIVPKDTVRYRCKLMRSFYESVNHSVPLFIALGNHEGEAGWMLNGTSENVAVWSTIQRKKYFTNPIPNNFYTGDTTHYNFVGQREAYYAWEWGDALFVVLDPYWHTNPKPDSLNGWRWTLGKLQYDWLKTTLENSTSKFKFVFAHQLVGGDKLGRGGIEYANKYEWGGANIDGTDGWATNRPGWYKPIKDLLEENRVAIFFHGHDHLYAKQDLNCIVYQEMPQPSMPNFQNVPNNTALGYVNGTIIPNSGNLKISVSSTGVNVEYIRAVRPTQETATLHNKDVSASYHIGLINCYDTLYYSVSSISNNISNNVNIYPNPFVNTVNIDISGKVYIKNISIIIFDINGKQITQLINNKSIGDTSFSTTWDGTNSTGNKVPNGIYFCKVFTDETYSISKILLNQ